MVIRAAPWALALGLTGCIDVPALSFHAPADSGTVDPAGSDAEPRPDALPGAPDGRPNPADARGANADARPDARRDTPDRGADAAVNGDADLAADAVKPLPDAPLAVDARALDPDATVSPTLDAFAPPPMPDAFVPPPDFDAFVPPPMPDAFVPPPMPDMAPPPMPDMAPPPLPDMAPPPLPDMAPPPLPDMAPPPLPDMAVLPPGILVVPRSVPGPTAGRRFGAALALVPDQNGDGFADVVVGAPRVAAGGAPSSALHVIDGVTGVEISHHFERNEPDGFAASLVAGPFVGNNAGWQVIVGAPTSNNNRGTLFAHLLPTLEQIESVSGQDQNGRFGHALALAHDGAQLLALTSLPGVPFSPRVLLYQLREGAPGLWNLDRHARVNADVIAAGNFGANLLGLPPTQAGNQDDFVAVADAFPATARRVLRYRNGSPAPLVAEYVPSAPDMTTGTSLLALSGPEPRMVVGTPGRGNGVVSVFARDGMGNQAPISELTPLGPAPQFGSSLALAPLLTTPAGDPPVVCIGAVGTPPNIPGAVECRGLGADANRLQLVAPVGADAFGRTLAVASARDPDGTWLIVVGAPDTSGPNGTLGGIVLHRVTSPP